MPPRIIVAAVVLGWLAANAWLVYREAVPYWRASGPPPYTIDLTEELGSSIVNWKIWQKNKPKPIGRAVSQVERQPDRSYLLRTNLYFDSFQLAVLEVKKLATVYHINEEGELLGVSAQCLGRLKHGKDIGFDFDLETEGQVVNGEIAPKLSLNKTPLPIGELKLPLLRGGNVLNPMHLLNRVPGLREGRAWRITLFDPMKSLGKALPDLQEVLQAAEGMTIPELHAEVVADTLWWDGDDVPCYRIDYRKPGDPEPVAATWVRRRDGLVLQQHSTSALLELTLTRDPSQ
jgi:hypothetical protein